MLLPVVTEFSLPAAPERYARIAAEMGAGDLVTALRELNHATGIPSLHALNVPADRYESLIEKMSTDALASGSPANNPRTASAGEIAELFRRAYEA